MLTVGYMDQMVFSTFRAFKSNKNNIFLWVNLAIFETKIEDFLVKTFSERLST